MGMCGANPLTFSPLGPPIPGNPGGPCKQKKNNKHAHKLIERYLSKLVLLSTTSHQIVMSAPGGPQLQFQLAKGWVATID